MQKSIADRARRYGVSIAVLTVGFIVACETPSTSDLLTHHLSGEGPTAIASGVLTEESGCLYLRANVDAAVLVLWPRVYARRGQSVFVGSELVASIGDEITLGGGRYPLDQYRFVQTLVDQEIPAECRTGDFWLATGHL